MLPQKFLLLKPKVTGPSFFAAQTEVLKFNVTVESACLGEGGPAECAAKGPLARMHPLVRDEI